VIARNRDKAIQGNLDFLSARVPRMLGLPAGPSKQGVSLQMRSVASGSFCFYFLMLAATPLLVIASIFLSRTLSGRRNHPDLESVVRGKLDWLRSGPPNRWN